MIGPFLSVKPFRFGRSQHQLPGRTEQRCDVHTLTCDGDCTTRFTRVQHYCRRTSWASAALRCDFRCISKVAKLSSSDSRFEGAQRPFQPVSIDLQYANDDRVERQERSQELWADQGS